MERGGDRAGIVTSFGHSRTRLRRHACLAVHPRRLQGYDRTSPQRGTVRMPPALETIVKQLEDSGIVAAGKLEDFVPPKASPKNADELVAELVKQNHLTRFQAQQVIAGKAKALILGSYTILERIGAGGMGQV